MKLLLCGMWHLGCVTAACISDYHQTIGSDPDAEIIAGLRAGHPPISEPGMTDALAASVAAGRLTFTDDAASAASDADVVWITFDTPVDEHDEADVEFVMCAVEELLPLVRANALVIVSSQVPIGSSARLKASARRLRPEASIRFACLPENLRLGQAMEIFRHPDRVIAGVDAQETREQIEALLRPMGEIKLEWMSLESAEMTKHSINSFLAMSLSFINEIAALCERTGADAREVERGLRTESRIGPKAYVAPGPGYAGGTLARDIKFLKEAATREGTVHDVIAAVESSNAVHRRWMVDTTVAVVGGDVRGKTIAVWGLTYKPGTDTLRRSTAVELCIELALQGAEVQAFDPALHELPSELAKHIRLMPSALDAATGAHVLVICTEWPELAAVDGNQALSKLRLGNVVDAKRFLEKNFANAANYTAIGAPRRFRVNA